MNRSAERRILWRRSALALAIVVACLALACWGTASSLAYAGDALSSADADAAAVFHQGVDRKARTYPIIYKLRGGKQAAGQQSSVKAGKAVKVASLAKPHRRGFKFQGWYRGPKLAKKAVRVKGAPGKAGRTLYAKWRRTAYPIVYKLAGGAFDEGRVKMVGAGKSLAVSKLKKPARLGYTFKGWYANPKRTVKAKRVRGVASAARRTVYAKWSAKNYRIAYVLNGGAFTGSHAKSYTMPDGLSKLPVPAREGYAFMGWFSDPDCTEAVLSIPKGSRGAKTLYAKWRIRVLVAHRGYHATCAENTVAAFEAAKDVGFTYVETDVRFTKDGVPVLIHDASFKVSGQYGVVDVNDSPELSPPDSQEPASEEGASGANGSPALPAPAAPVSVRWEQFQATAVIASMTYDELQDLEETCANLGISMVGLDTADEFLDSCSRNALRPYIEIKRAAGVTEERLGDLARSVRNHGLVECSRWISFSSDYLSWVQRFEPSASLGLLTNTFTSADVDNVFALASGGADVVLSLSKSQISKSVVKDCKKAGIPLELWTLADEAHVAKYNKYDRYVSGFTINGLAGPVVPELV